VECEEYPQAVVRAGHPTSPGAELPIRAHGAGQTPLDDDEDAAVVVAHVALWSRSAEEGGRDRRHGLAVAALPALADPLG